jgi:hypothetical protein
MMMSSMHTWDYVHTCGQMSNFSPHSGSLALQNGDQMQKETQSFGWVAYFTFIKSNSIVAGTQISKGATDVVAGMKAFTAVIAVINYPHNHWVTLQFNPKIKMLEVLDSIAPKHVAQEMENIRKVSLPP